MSNAHATIKHARMEQGLGFGCNPPLRVDVTLVFNFHPFYSRHFLAMDMSSLLFYQIIHTSRHCLDGFSSI